MLAHIVAVSGRFLSTLSLRRATAPQTQRRCQIQYFYPRSPCGERRCLQGWRTCHSSISIHALLAESDGDPEAGWVGETEFLSTLSLRRATSVGELYLSKLEIFLSTLSLRRATMICMYCVNTTIFLSTLSLRRATAIIACISTPVAYFYPRSPCGERPCRRA